MTEVIEAMTAGESIAVMVQELYEVVLKVAYTDSQAAEAILTCDGSSWRTRHLRLRSSFARQSILFCGFGHTLCTADLQGRSTVGESCRSKAPSSITRKSPWRSEARRKVFKRKRSFKPWRALRCCCPLTASSSTSSSSSQPPQVQVKSAPRQKGVPKVKSLPKMGHAPNLLPSPRVPQPKSRSQSSNRPTVEEDIFGSWGEIEREEGQIRMELSAAAPGDPILGPIDQLPDEEFPDLSFEPKLSTFGFGEHWSGERFKMVQSLPTGCIPKRIVSCSWCHPVSEGCTFRYAMSDCTWSEPSSNLHGMFRGF